MSTAILEQTAKPEPHATPAGAGINDVKSLDVIDLSSVSTEDVYRTLSAAAGNTGVALINNLSLRAPIGAIQKLFGRLYADPALASRLNATYPTRGVFKAACLDPASSPKVDQKTTIDLSVNRLEELRRLDPALVEELGQDFSDVLDFHSVVEADLLPVLTQATSSITGADLAPLHKGVNNNLRLID